MMVVFADEEVLFGNKSLADLRTVGPFGVRWYPTKEMITDPTTKLDLKLEEKMRAWTEENQIRLGETDASDASVRKKLKNEANEENGGDCEKKCEPDT